MARRVLWEVGTDGVAIITIVNPPLNLLSFDVMLSLKESIEEALLRDDVKALVINGSNNKFSGGFNVTAFGGSHGSKKRAELGFLSIDFATDALEAARKPIVAAIDGPAFGGGLEIAMACHARISTATAQLGLTELQYGIIPGLGGTQRLPRLIGIPKALEMMLMSKRVSGKEAKNMFLVDAIAPRAELLKEARCWALDILEGRKPWIATLYRTDRLEPLKEARLILNLAKVQVQKQSPSLKHPLVCINVIEEGIVFGARHGLWKEAEALNELRQSETCRSLVHIFFAQYGTSKIPGITDMGLLPRKIYKVAVIGGGLIGSGIATVFILSNFHVILKEVNEKLLLAGIGRIKSNLQSLLKKEKVTEEKLKHALSCLKGVLDYGSFRNVHLVLEAVQENLLIKQHIFYDLETYCPRHCIFASGTSTLDLNLIAAKTKSHNRIVGAHFFGHAHVVSLMEIVLTERTSPQVIVDLLDVGKKIKKTSVVVWNCTGSAVRRMFFPYSQAAKLLAERGVDIYRIDQAIKSFGLPMGPFRMIDQVGFRVSMASDMQFVEKFPERCNKSMLTQTLLEDKREGESTQKGFYLYNEEAKARPDPEIKKYYVEKARCLSHATINSKLAKLSDADIVEMILFPVVNEACRLLAEGIAVKASDLDVASVMGMGFPSYRGGIIFWADALGTKRICSRLEDWSNDYGNFFKPCAYLAEHASEGNSLGSQIKQGRSQL